MRGREGKRREEGDRGKETRVSQSLSEVTQSCPTLCGPMDGSLPGSSVHGIFQARVLEWVAIAFSTHRNTCPIKEQWVIPKKAHSFSYSVT